MASYCSFYFPPIQISNLRHHLLTAADPIPILGFEEEDKTLFIMSFIQFVLLVFPILQMLANIYWLLFRLGE